MIAKIFEHSEWINETRPDFLMAKYEKDLIDAGFNICNIVTKFFSPFGFTALFLLSESHFAIHTFPEEDKTYIQLSSCVQKPFEQFWRIQNNDRESKPNAS